MTEARKKTVKRTGKPSAKKAKSTASNRGGRPRKIKDPAQFDEMVDRYVTECRENDQPITWTGMASALGFSSRKEIDNYARYDGFADSCKRARIIVENAYEKRLHTNSPTGAIFALKNMGWKDRQDHEHGVSNELAALLAEIGGTPKSSPMARLKMEHGED